MDAEQWALHIAVALKIMHDPNSWNQATYASSCGTAFCYAGHAISLSGYKFVQKDFDRSDYVYAAGMPDPFEESFDHSELGHVIRAAVAGRILLGLTDDVADWWFASHRSFPEMMLRLNDLARYDEVELPPELRLTPAQMREISTAPDIFALDEIQARMLYPEGVPE